MTQTAQSVSLLENLIKHSEAEFRIIGDYEMFVQNVPTSVPATYQW